MDKDELNGMTKILNKQVEIQVRRYKYEIQGLKKKLVELEAAKGARTGPGLLRWLKRKKLPHLDDMISQTKRQIEELEKVYIDGILTPLTVRDRFLCLNEMEAHRLVMMERLTETKSLTEARKKAYERTIDITGEMIFRVASLSQVLKKKTQGGLEQFFTFDEACNLSPQLVVDIMNYHASNFILTEEEAKK